MNLEQRCKIPSWRRFCGVLWCCARPCDGEKVAPCVSPARRSGCVGVAKLAVAVGGPTVGRGVAPQLWTAHPRGPSQNIPIRASKGMTCPDLGEVGFGRGRAFSPVVFPAPLLLI